MPTIYNKVTVNGDTLIDLSGDTVASAADIVAGKIGHLNDGTQVTGTASGGGTDFIVELSYDDTEEMWVPDCTFAEIQSAYSSGKNIAVKIDDVEIGARGGYSSEDVCFYYTVFYYDYDTSRFIVLWYIFNSNGVTDDDSVSYYGTFNATAVPSDVAQGKIFYNSNGEQTGTYVPSSGSSKNVQIASGVDRVATTSYTAVNGQSITVAKTGTYDVYWTGYRSSTSGTSGSQLYIDSTAYGSAQTTFTNHGQSVHLSNVSLTAGQVVTVRARARGTSYYMYVGNLTIIEA